MCGIAGWVSFGEQRPPLGTAGKMLLALQERGKDATGLAYAPKWKCKSVGFMKHYVAAKEFVPEAENKGHLAVADKSQICLLHTRTTTKGSEKKNVNNHPVFREGGKYILVHNGIVSNDDAFFEKHKIQRQAEVDTESLAGLLDLGRTAPDARHRLQEAGGTYSVAAIPKEAPDHLILVRRSSPLFYALSADSDIFAFGSTAAAALLAFAGSGEILYRGLPNSKLPCPILLADNTYLIIGPGGLIERGTHAVTTEAEASERKYLTGQDWDKWGDEYDWPPKRTNGTKSQVSSRMPFKVTSAIAFMRPTHSNGSDPMTRFTGPFPLVASREEPMHVTCPACWQWIVAQELIPNWVCPKCEKKLIAPTVFRTLRPTEEASGKIYLG